MKLGTLTLIVLLGLIHFGLWFGPSSLLNMYQLQKELTKQTEQTEQLAKRNYKLTIEVNNLKKDDELIEEYARHELGMTKKDETFYQFIEE